MSLAPGRIAEILSDMIAAALRSEAWDGGRTGAEAETAPTVVALRAALDAYESREAIVCAADSLADAALDKAHEWNDDYLFDRVQDYRELSRSPTLGVTR